jgi:type IV pilus assembly protein PilV
MFIDSNKMKNQMGLGLIESLIALLVISIGLLGIAALQITSMQQTSSSQWHSQAIWYSYEMTDRISANSANYALYDKIDTNKSYSMDCKTNSCTPVQMMTADAQDWSDMVKTLPEGRGVITLNQNSLTVSVIWQDNAGESNCTNGEPHTSTQSCFTVTITP